MKMAAFKAMLLIISADMTIILRLAKTIGANPNVISCGINMYGFIIIFLKWPRPSASSVVESAWTAAVAAEKVTVAGLDSVSETVIGAIANRTTADANQPTTRTFSILYARDTTSEKTLTGWRRPAATATDVDGSCAREFEEKERRERVQILRHEIRRRTVVDSLTHKSDDRFTTATSLTGAYRDGPQHTGLVFRRITSVGRFAVWHSLSFRQKAERLS